MYSQKKERTNVTVYMTVEEFEKLRSIAEVEHRSISQQILHYVSKGISSSTQSKEEDKNDD